MHKKLERKLISKVVNESVTIEGTHCSDKSVRYENKYQFKHAKSQQNQSVSPSVSLKNNCFREKQWTRLPL